MSDLVVCIREPVWVQVLVKVVVLFVKVVIWQFVDRLDKFDRCVACLIITTLTKTCTQIGSLTQKTKSDSNKLMDGKD